MNRKATLILVAVGLLIAAGLALLWSGRSEPGAAEGGADATQSRPEGSQAAVGPDKGNAEVHRQEASAPRADGKPAAAVARDADYDRHLAGFTGRIVNQKGAPVPQCPVKIYVFDMAEVMKIVQSPFGEGGMEPAIDLGATQTDEDGRFTLTRAEPHAMFTLVAGDGVTTATTFRLIQRSPAPGELVDLGDISLRDSVVVTGRVVDAADAPVTGALVRALDLPGALLALAPIERFEPEGSLIVRAAPGVEIAAVVPLPAWVKRRFEELPIPQTRTDSDGKFRLVGVDIGMNTLLVTAIGRLTFVNPTLRTKSGLDKDVGVVKLAEGEVAQGRIIDALGKPVARAEVLVAPTSAALPVDFAGKPLLSDADGRFEQKGMPSGSATVAARRGPKDRWTIQPPAPVASDLVVRLPALATLTVRLASKAGKKLEQSKLRLVATPAQAPLALAGFATDIPLEGRSEHPTPDVTRIADLPLGSYLMFATAKGHEQGVASLKLERDQELVLDLAEEVLLPVSVTDQDGRPIRRATIYARTDARLDADEREVDRELSQVPLLAGTTDAAGKAEARLGANAKSVVLSATHPAYGPTHVRVELPAREATLVMQAPGAVEGVLTEKGAPPKPGVWVVEISLPWSEDRIFGPLPDLDRFAIPDERGAFKIAGLRPGKYTAKASKSLGSVRSAGTFYEQVWKRSMSWSWFEDESTEFTVEGGKTTTIALDTDRTAKPVDGPSAHVTGTVTIDGRAAEGCKLVSWDEQRLSATVDAAGRFDLGRVRAGNAYLQLIDPSAKDPWETQLWGGQLQIRADQDRNLTIDVRLAAIGGTVYAPGGEPAAKVSVHAHGGAKGEAEGESQHMNLRTTTDEQGRFRFEKAPAALYTVIAEDDKIGRGQVGGLAVASGDSKSIEIRMRRAYCISGKIDLTPLGTPRSEWTWVHLQPTDTKSAFEGGGRGAQIDAEGSFKVTGLSPGEYTVQVFTEKSQWRGKQKLVLGERDLEDASITIERQGPPQPEVKPEEERKEEKK